MRWHTASRKWSSCCSTCGRPTRGSGWARTAAWGRRARPRILVEEEREGRTILVDDLNGTAHQRYGAMPNTVYVIDSEGTVVYRAMWNDSPAVEMVLKRLSAGQDVGSVPAAFRPAPPATPMRVLRRAGWRALWDFAAAFPVLAWTHIRSRR
jgi:hypothetical protein